MKRLAIVIPLLLALSHGALAQQSAVADSIRRQADRLIAAIASKAIDQFVALFTSDPDFISGDAGNIYPNPPTLRKTGPGVYRGSKPFNAKRHPTTIEGVGP